MIEVDGSFGEGGGQVVRTSVALAALLSRDVRVVNIRAKRPNPGLRAQHITAVKAVAALCDAITEGLDMNSTELTFKPRRRMHGEFRFDVGTAGSISLVLQALMPAAGFAPGPVRFDITGGTDVRWSPTIDYVRFVMLPLLSRMGYEASLTLHRRGHYPKGGGRVSVEIHPSGSLRGFSLIERGEIMAIRGLSHCVRLPPHVADRQAKAARDYLDGAGFTGARIDVESHMAERDPHLGPGSGIALYADCSQGAILGSDSLGERGKPAERVGSEAAERLARELRANVAADRHMGDILIPYMAVAEGRSEIATSEITMHTITNAKIAEVVSGAKIEVLGDLGSPGRIIVHGVGLRR